MTGVTKSKGSFLALSEWCGEMFTTIFPEFNGWKYRGSETETPIATSLFSFHLLWQNALKKAAYRRKDLFWVTVQGEAVWPANLNLTGKFQVNEYFVSKRWTGPREWNWRLTSDLYIHAHTCVFIPIHICMFIAVYTWTGKHTKIHKCI